MDLGRRVTTLSSPAPGSQMSARDLHVLERSDPTWLPHLSSKFRCRRRTRPCGGHSPADVTGPAQAELTPAAAKVSPRSCWTPSPSAPPATPGPRPPARRSPAIGAARPPSAVAPDGVLPTPADNPSYGGHLDSAAAAPAQQNSLIPRSFANTATGLSRCGPTAPPVCGTRQGEEQA